MFTFTRGRARADGDESPLRLAELVAEVARNTAGPPPHFDQHAGWTPSSVSPNPPTEYAN